MIYTIYGFAIFFFIFWCGKWLLHILAISYGWVILASIFFFYLFMFTFEFVFSSFYLIDLTFHFLLSTFFVSLMKKFSLFFFTPRKYKLHRNKPVLVSKKDNDQIKSNNSTQPQSNQQQSSPPQQQQPQQQTQEQQQQQQQQ